MEEKSRMQILNREGSSILRWVRMSKKSRMLRKNGFEPHKLTFYDNMTECLCTSREGTSRSQTQPANWQIEALNAG